MAGGSRPAVGAAARYTGMHMRDDRDDEERHEDDLRVLIRFDRLRQFYPNASDETIQRYLDLRDEGFDQYRASLMAGLADPDDGE
jgi:hypothetical protein